MGTVDNLKITTLAENTCGSDGRSFHCLGQWGLSLLLELEDGEGEPRKIVFDTGLHARALQHNIRKLKADLRGVGCIVLSHGHADHASATVEMVRTAGKPVVYAHPHAFLPRFWESCKGERLDLGVPKGQGKRDIEKAGGKVMVTTKPQEVFPGVWTTGQVKRTTPFERPLPLPKGERSVIVIDGKEADDLILDDQALWMDVKGFGPLVITGCAHAGVVNTLLQVKRLAGSRRIGGLVGGTHLVERKEECLRRTIMRLEDFRLRLLSPCHCTGLKGMSMLMRAFPSIFVGNYSGKVIEVGRGNTRAFEDHES